MLDPWDDVMLTQQFEAHTRTSLPRAPLNSALCSIIGPEAGLRGLLGHAPPAQRLPVLLLAAIHFHVLGEPRAELAAWYPTVADEPRDPTDPALERELRSFVADREHVIAATIAERHVQTNEVGRCALFVPSMCDIGAALVAPLAHVDMGTSAGLNLLLPHVRVAYHDDDGDHVVGDGPLGLACGVRGELSLPGDARLPTIDRSIGVDPRPADLHDADAMRWLAACCWPDELERFHRLRDAIELARASELDVRRGSLDDIGTVIEGIDASVHPVVTTSWVLNYVDPAERRAWLDQLESIGRRRDLDWIFAESPALTPELPHPPSLAGEHTTAVVRVSWRAGCRSDHHVARAHPHGHWMHALD